jgi:transcription antitermination factor NusG
VTEGIIMELVTAGQGAAQSKLPEECLEEKWYAVYTWARHEKCVAAQMGQRRIRGFLPLYRSVHRWKDRRKEVELALFPSYVFVRLALRDRVRVLEIPGVVSIVSSRGKPIPLADREIESLQRGVDSCVSMEPHPFLQVGRRVRVRCGPFVGMEGILVRRKEGFRLVASIELLMRAVAIEIDEADVEACR